MAAGVMRNPVAQYIDRHAGAEKAEVVLPLSRGGGPPLAVRGGRGLLHRDVVGVPVLVSRQDDGSLKALLNVCRHRGSLVTFEECGNRRSFTCPYHAWTYRADGSLSNIPYDEGFEGLDRSTMGLVELPVEERHGLIWVVLAPGQPIDVASHLGALDEELASYAIGDYLVERSTILRADLNWKIVVDGFLETYHLRFLHSSTVGPYIKTNLAPSRRSACTVA